ncbi:MAG: tRNA (adenosine(37)-N6)-threonylcarbamoyltransferase complex dimerization subunit type 1 TsaB [Erysipelotrichaceae bacterium]|nr:tRNA (adenosine(37)-N6)-threonylcarbamoyltransferase complex dimerization subunit type 1 TsaB [Erysipelotrichaceae bacterium]
MKILYIDTSTDYLYTGIVSDNILLAEIKQKFSHDLSKYALYEISEMLKKVNINPTEVDKIIVVNGPGSFTGIRVGMTIAKIYAYTLKKKIISISSLDAMQIGISSNNLIVPVIDARRGFVYAGIYQDNKELLKKQYIKFEDLLDKLNNYQKEYIIVSNDNLKIDNVVSYNPDILKIVNTYKDNEDINPHLVEPNYLKLTEAEENLQRN